MRHKADPNHPFYDRLNELVKQKISSDGKSPTGISIEMQMHSTKFWRYLDRKTMPSVESLEKMADYFGVTTDYLLGRKGE